MTEKPCILIVDDDAGLRNTLSDLLKAKNYFPVTAATGKHALDMAEKHMPDVALIDLKLEDMSGLDIIRKIKGCHPGTECIIFTAYASKESAIHAVNLGAYSYVQKPYDMDQLLLVIQKAIDKLKRKKKLRESEEKYRSILETTSEGYWLLNSENRILEVNKSFCNILGYNRDEMLGKTPFEFADDGNQKIFMEQISKISTTTHQGYEIALKKNNGQDLQTYFNTTTIRDKSGEVQGSFAFITDITEYKRTQEERDRLAIAIEQASESVFITDRNGMIQYVNPAFERLTGYDRKDAIGQNPGFLRSGKHDDRFYKEMWHSITRGEAWHGRIINKKKRRQFL